MRAAVAFVAAFAVLSCSAGAGEIADCALGSDGRSTAGGGTASSATICDTAIGEEVPEKDAPETHEHETVKVKVEPIAEKAPRPGKLAVADSAVVEAEVVPTSCAVPDEAVHGRAKPSDATSAPSCDTVMAGAGLMATIEAPPVDALASTEGGVVTFSVSTATRIGADSATSTAPLIHVHETWSWNKLPIGAEAPRLEKLAVPPAVVVVSVPTSCTVGAPGATTTEHDSTYAIPFVGTPSRARVTAGGGLMATKAAAL